MNINRELANAVKELKMEVTKLSECVSVLERKEVAFRLNPLPTHQYYPHLSPVNPTCPPYEITCNGESK